MNKEKEIIVLVFVLVLLGVFSGFIYIDLTVLNQFAQIALPVLYTYWTGGSGRKNNST